MYLHLLRPCWWLPGFAALLMFGVSQAGPLVLEDVPKPLVSRRPRTEADEDRLEALSLFAAGRMLQRQQKYAEALRLYQRALRCDPQSVAVARAIIPLAFRLKRHAEAVRYALKAAEIEDADPLLLRRLGVYLTEHGDFARAVGLYEKAVAARTSENETAAEILLRMEMGRLYHLVEQYGKAADNFARVRDALDHPNKSGLDDRLKKVLLGEPGLTYNLFGECFLRAGRADEAVASFEQAHRADPNKGRLEFNLARVHAQRGKPDLALAALEACFKEKLDSEGTAPYKLLAEVLEKLGKQQELIDRLEKLRADDPENVPLGYFLAGQYRQAEQLDKAEPLYLVLMKETPTLTGYRSLSEIYRKTKQTERLLAILGEAVAKTGTLEAFGSEAETLCGDAELMRGLVETARKLAKDEPKKLDFGRSYAVALLAAENKQFETAAEFFDLAVKTGGDQAAEVFLVWGVGLLLAERPAEAAKVFQRAIDQKVLPDDNPAFYFYLAGALAFDEQADKALAAARKAAEQKKDSARFRSRVAWVLYHAKRNDEAIKAYTRLIEEFDSDHKSIETREVLREARLVLSNLYVLKDDMAQAEEWLQQVLDEFPDDVGASNDLGYLWADQNKHLNRALRMIRFAVDAEPDNVAYRDSLGWVLYRLGKYKQAVAELEKAAGGDDQPDAVILDHLGDACLKAGQPEKAKDTWRRAVKAFQKEEEPEKAKAVEKKIKDQIPPRVARP